MWLLSACGGPVIGTVPGTTGDVDTSDTGGVTDTGDPGSSGATDTGSEAGTSTGAGESTSTGTTGDPAICGDGVVDPGEVCDDGDQDDDDECVACQPATCGDGHVHAGEEQCDDGNLVDADECTNACNLPICGDAIVQAGEVCDDGNTDQYDECTNVCMVPACGDGIVQAGEECDEGGESVLCDLDCTPPACGDGTWNATTGELCDDGPDGSAACDADCTPAECGDGQISPLAGETCDDGNVSDSDFCSSSCVKARRVIFVTSATYTGNLGGFAGADAKCQALAASAGFPGTFYAWLSSGATSPEGRFLQSDIPYALPNGIEVADDWDDLTDGTLQHAIDMTEKGTAAPIPNDGCGGGTKPTVWTNTHESAAAWTNNGCSGWTSTTSVGRLGHAKATNFTWTRYCEGQAGSCAWHAALYCVEQ